MTSNSLSFQSKKEQAALLIQHGQLDAAKALLEEIVRMDRRDADSWFMLAVANHRLGARDAATSGYEKTLLLNPRHAQAYYFLGNVRGESLDHEGAIRCYRKALQLVPQFVEAALNLGAILQHLERHSEAIECYERSLEQGSASADIHFSLGNALADVGRYSDAIARYRDALALEPRRPDILINLGETFAEQGRLEQAIECLTHALSLSPDDGPRMRLATLLPPIPESLDDLRRWRSRFETEIAALEQRPLRLVDPVREVSATGFFLSYHGLNNRELNTRLGKLYQGACPSLGWSAPHCAARTPKAGKLRVGFVSRFFYNHSIGRTSRGIIAKLSRERFEVVSLFVPALRDDEISKFIGASSDRSVVLPLTLDSARSAVAELQLDILFYQDIGMEPFTYFLAFSRLAPVQCVSFGHPDTTGIANMDYFISSDLFESADAAGHYSERLFLLRDAGTLAYYYRPRLPETPKRREDFGLPAGGSLYACPQTLFKFHPEFDPVIAGILRADPGGRIVLIRPKNSNWVDLLQARFRKAMPDVVDRVMFIPQQRSDDFLSLLAVSDVMLDTVHFNGMNTSLEAFSVGTPIVTLPTEFQRGRHTAGMYRKMGFTECTAADKDDYVRIAAKLGTQEDYRRFVRSEILRRTEVLFEDIHVVQEFERCFLEMHERVG